jgi:DNA-binding transcriptional LysR family regulator
MIGSIMETTRLKQFCTVVETGNLRKAAELLGISHSGLFKSLKVLEAEVGFALFLPSGRGIVVSDRGRDLYQRTERFFSEFERLLGQSEAMEDSLIRVGSFEVFTTAFMARFARDYLPSGQIEVHELVPGRLEEALLLNRIDFGITYEPVPRPGIEYMKVTRIWMGIYALQGQFTRQPVTEIPFVVPVTPLEGAPSGVKGLDSWPEDRFKRRGIYKVDLMNTGLELVRSGLCAIFIPQFVARLHNESALPKHRLELLPLPKGMAAVSRDVYLVKRESTGENEISKKVARALREICGNPKSLPI